jgi:type III secretion system FlhB-like substrate exporter
MKKILSLFLVGTALLTSTLIVKANDHDIQLTSNRTVKIALPPGTSNTAILYVRLIADDTGENFSNNLSSGVDTIMNKVGKGPLCECQVKSKSASHNPIVFIGKNIPPGHYKLIAQIMVNHFGIYYDAEIIIAIKI